METGSKIHLVKCTFAFSFVFQTYILLLCHPRFHYNEVKSKSKLRIPWCYYNSLETDIIIGPVNCRVFVPWRSLKNKQNLMFILFNMFHLGFTVYTPYNTRRVCGFVSGSFMNRRNNSCFAFLAKKKNEEEESSIPLN